MADIKLLDTNWIKKGSCVDWKSNIPKIIKFYIDGREEYINLIGYNKEKNYIRLQYLDNEPFEIEGCSFLKGGFYNKINKYKKNDIVKTNTGSLKIIDYCIKKKNTYTEWFYLYECVKCGNKDEMSANNLNYGYGCNVCSNKKVLKGFNDIATLRPDLIRYFLNKEDSFKISIKSNKSVDLKCPNCGSETSMKVSNLVNRKFYCLACDDGISYPNKLMFNVLNKLGVEFKPEKLFDWSKNKKYDFYLPKYKIVLEMMGEQHYRYTGRGRSLEEEQTNDKLKKEEAIQNGYQYIDIDCSVSDLSFIKSNILNSSLINCFDFSNIDWIECSKLSEKSILVAVCKEWGNVKDTLLLANIFKLNRSTIIRYLHRGNKLGICDYVPYTKINVG